MPLKKRDGELILEWLEELGFEWVGKRENVCGETPSEKKKRFKLYEQAMMTVGLSLWFGTSLLIPCDDTAFPEEDEFGWYRDDANGKELVMTIAIYVGKRYASPEITKEYQLYLSNSLEILPPQYSNYRKSFATLEELRQFLDTLKTLLKAPN
jgi:hypothetical protein